MIALTLALLLLSAPQTTPAQEPSEADAVLRRTDLALRPVDGGDVLLLALPQEQAARAWIGVEIATQEDGGPGLEVARVVTGSPAERAGLRVGDRLLALGDARLADFDALRARLSDLRPGQRVQLSLRRTVRVELDQRGWGDGRGPRLGVSLSEQRNERGSLLVVAGLERGWPAAAAGLRAGDRLVEAGGRELEAFDTLQQVLAGVGPGDGVELVLERQVALVLGSFPQGDAPETGPGEELRFRLQPDRPGGTERDEAPAPDGQPRWFGLPETPRAPRAPSPFGQPQGPGLESLQQQMRTLTRELQTLREELRALRAELEQLRRQRAR